MLDQAVEARFPELAVLREPVVRRAQAGAAQVDPVRLHFLEVLARGVGDCEDFVIAKYFSLRDLGVSDARLRLTYVKARVGGPGSSVFLAHMVLSYYPTPDSVPLILDNLIRDIRPASSRPDLAPVYSFNSQGIFVGTANQVASPVDRVSRWPELLVRMRAEGYEP